MTLIVQNDLGTVDGANAYIDVAFADSYFTLRGNATWAGLATPAKEQAIIQATDYIDNRFTFKGNKLTSTQTTQFPRSDLHDRSGNLVSGLPLNLKKACAEYAVRASQGELAPDPIYDERGGIVTGRRIRAGSVEKDVNFAASGSKIIYRSYPLADMLLSEYFISSGQIYRG